MACWYALAAALSTILPSILWLGCSLALPWVPSPVFLSTFTNIYCPLQVCLAGMPWLRLCLPFFCPSFGLNCHVHLFWFQCCGYVLRRRQSSPPSLTRFYHRLFCPLPPTLMSRHQPSLSRFWHLFSPSWHRIFMGLRWNFSKYSRFITNMACHSDFFLSIYTI